MDKNDDQALTPDFQEDVKLINKAIKDYDDQKSKCNRCGDVLHVTDMHVLGTKYYCIPCMVEIEQYL